MKLIFGEHKPNYSLYNFPYQVWLLKEENDSVDGIYNMGFLPMRNLYNVYYLCRSLRVALNRFVPSSENRRILRKTENISFDILDTGDFEYTGEVQRFCLKYSKERIGPGIFSAKSLKSIFKGSTFNKIFVFKENKNEVVGYAVCYENKNLLHYSHSFYNVEYFEKSLGAGMMLKCIIWAKENQKKYSYLGTCYEQKTLYKTEYDGCEFYNGFRWSSDLEELKYLIINNSDRYLFKNKEYLEKYYKSDLNDILSKYGIRVK